MKTLTAKNPNKKQKRAEDSKHRVRVSMNTATKTFKSAKDYNREDGKKICREYDQDGRNEGRY